MERIARLAKTAFISIAVAIALVGCDDTRELKQRAEIAEQKLEQLQKRLDEAEREVLRTREYRRAAAVAQACDRPVVWRLCPASDVELGRAALAAGYTADEIIYWFVTTGLLAAVSAAMAAATATGWVLWLRIAAPAEKDVEEARKLIESAEAEAKRWQSKSQEAQRAASAAQDELKRLREQKTQLKSELSSLQSELEQTRSDLDALRGGFL